MEQYRLSERDELSLDAAKFYYSGLSQAEVAKRLHLGRTTVSKLLAHARRRGFIQTVVKDRREDDKILIETLQHRYGLHEVVLISPADTTTDGIRKALGVAGAQTLSSLVRDGDTIGMVYSRTVAALASNLGSQTRSNVSVVELSRGLTSPQDTVNYYPSALAHLASAFGGHYFQLGSPLFVSSVQEKNQLLNQSYLREVLAMGDSCRIAVYTVGDPVSNRELILKTPILPREREVINQRAVGDICSRFIDSHGRVCVPDLNNRTVGISLPSLRRKEQKMLIAGGTRKVEAVFAALEMDT